MTDQDQTFMERALELAVPPQRDMLYGTSEVHAEALARKRRNLG